MLGRMLIEISAAPDPPPRGHVRVNEGDPRPFAGWLQLLSILARTLPPPEPGATGRGPARCGDHAAEPDRKNP